jgi:AcrR family transcriptional regulator
MMMVRRTTRADETREAILSAAERMFAELGLAAVSNRQVSEAAGQGNNFAVGYHFGTRVGLVRAIIARHSERVEEVRARMLAELGGDPGVREWVACLVRPVTEHLASLGSPTWYARFGAQVTADPALRAIVTDDALTSPTLQRVLEGFNTSLPCLPLPVRLERGDMARQLITQVCAERERALAENTPVTRATWQDTATGLIDAIVGLLLAPVTPTAPGNSAAPGGTG